MPRLSEVEKLDLLRRIEAGEPLPEPWRERLFPASGRTAEVGKEYRLVYEGKARREEVLANTPAAPWQLVRRFCTERAHDDGPSTGSTSSRTMPGSGQGWRNLLVWGDNLLALRGLLADQQGPDNFGTKGRIKLIYIDPPFATRQDFMKDREKAYRDKVLGAQFIEFLRRRLILLHELLADDGSIYVHLDWKKSHYMKAVLDEVFGEVSFLSEIAWIRSFNAGSSKALANKFPANYDSLFLYAKTDRYVFNHLFKPYSEGAIRRYDKVDEEGRRFKWNPLKTVSQEKLARLIESGEAMVTPTSKYPVYRHYFDPDKGATIDNVWDIPSIGTFSDERSGYPTQKPAQLLDRIIRASSNPGDIVLDCFAGSGTTAAVAEKLGRRWIAMDCGKLAIYTIQKRLFSLTTTVGAGKKDERSEPERVEDWAAHLKSAPGVLLITEKARKGECEVTLELLHDLAALVTKHGLLKAYSAISLACPEEKLRIPLDGLGDPEDCPGAKRLVVNGVEFRISFVAPREKPEKDQPLLAKEFALYRAGVYDMAAIREMPWAEYRPFVLKLFGVREEAHQRYGFTLDGYLNTHSVHLWNYPDNKRLTLDYTYVDELHRLLRGKPGERIYSIAPVVAMDFAEDEVVREQTTYVFLKVPLSVLLRLLERKAPAALKQPTREEDVNEVIDAVGFDFISQPQVKVAAKRDRREDELFADWVIEIEEFRAQTLATDPEDFANFETFSMAMLDLAYDGDVFRLGKVFWAEDLLQEAGGLEHAERLTLRIPERDFTAERLMVILCDRYGNEKTLVFGKQDFVESRSAPRKPGGVRRAAR
jgi:16S rRNA G966 N2-methylase RsmD